METHAAPPSPLGLQAAVHVSENLRRLSNDPQERQDQLFNLRSRAAHIWLALPDPSVDEACGRGLLAATIAIAAQLVGTTMPDEDAFLLAQVRRALQEQPCDRSAFAAIAFLGHLGADEAGLFPAASTLGKRRLLPALFLHGVDLDEGGAEREFQRLQRVTEQILEWLPKVPALERRAFLEHLQPAYFLLPGYFLESDTVRTTSRREPLLRDLFDWPGMHLRHELAGPVPPGRKIRVGIMARSFEARSETYALLPVFEHLDRGLFDTVLLAYEVLDTPTEAYCASRAGRLLKVPENLPDLVSTLRALDLDILLFGNNLSVGLGVSDAALGLHRLARVQVNFICSPMTSGLPFLDRFLLGEGCEVEEGVERRYTERLERLPGSGFCFTFAGRDETPGRTPRRQDLGIRPEEVVFVSGANYFKLLPPVREAWCRILAAVPGSVLLLFPFGPAWSDHYPQEHFVETLLKGFDRHGIDRDRLVVVGAMKNVREIHSLLGCADVYLDAFPYSGATSLQDPLDAGLPMVVMEGRELRFRQGAAILREAGLDGLVAGGPEAYHQLAVRLGRDRVFHAGWAQAVRTAVSSGLPCRNSRAYGKQVGAAFERMLEDWNRGAQQPGSAAIPAPHEAPGPPSNGAMDGRNPTVRRSKFFRESAIVHRYLDGLHGLEIGGSAHNAFGVSTLNVDFTDDLTTPFKLEELRLCGEAMTVDIVGSGDAIPLPDKSVDFVLSSHVIEHFWDPIRALGEWRRLARKYVVIICPQRNALESDIPLPLTGLYELRQRHEGRIPPPAVDTHDHYNRWTSGMFCQLCEELDFEVLEVVDPDDKVGNGFLVVLRP